MTTWLLCNNLAVCVTQSEYDVTGFSSPRSYWPLVDQLANLCCVDSRTTTLSLRLYQLADTDLATLGEGMPKVHLATYSLYCAVV
jgi:hypothetical protein